MCLMLTRWDFACRYYSHGTFWRIFSGVSPAFLFFLSFFLPSECDVLKYYKNIIL